MTSRLFAFTTVLLMVATASYAQENEEEQSSDLMELHVIASSREQGAMRRQPASASLIDSEQLENLHTGSLKGISTLAPNFYMPDYGSRLSSAVYIRGIGSRINSPAIGLYVDDVPVLDKSSFDFELHDMQRVDILRGPQSTLYGTGTMGGVMKVYSISPFEYQGTNISLGYATSNNLRKATLMHYSRPTERFAWSFGGYYNGGDGFFKNSYTNEKIDYTSGGGISFRAMFLTKHNWMFDIKANYEINNEGAYPYYYVGNTTGVEDKNDQLHRINNNITGLYERSIVRTSANISKVFRKVEFRSITAFQALSDTMQMDQDFLYNDIYKLSQKQNNLTVTEDIILKSHRPGRWQWITGATGSFLHSRIKAPVTFREEGVTMLNGMINQMAGQNMPIIQSGPMTMKFNFSDMIQDEELTFDNKFTTYNVSAGAFHQSTIHDIFNVRGLSFTAGFRLNTDVKHLDYDAWYDFSHEYQLSGHLTMPSQNGMVERDVTMIPATKFNVKNELSSKKGNNYPHKTQLEWMPRVAVQYEMERCGNVYATVSRGYRSGGYNVQNISEVMRSLMISDMMTDVRDVTLPVLEKQPMVPQDTKEKVGNILNGMANTPIPNIGETCTYEPEYAWNYEVGGHFNLLDGKLFIDASAFLSDIRNLQLSQMSETGLGRIMVNAGKSRSAGLELMLKARPIQNLLVQGNYGYTHATFLNYSDYDSNKRDYVDCKGNYVPFMPQHTVNADICYTIPLNSNLIDDEFDRFSFALRSLSFGVNYSGAGKIYWTEQNDAFQNFYSMLGARASLDMHPLTISVWGRNLTNSQHNTFWFVSSNRAYEQHAKPIQFGIDAKFSF